MFFTTGIRRARYLSSYSDESCYEGQTKTKKEFEMHLANFIYMLDEVEFGHLL